MKVKIKEIAKQNKGWSLYRLSQELGLPQQTVYSWATGRTQPNYKNMDLLCHFLECGIADLFEFQGFSPSVEDEIRLSIARRALEKKYHEYKNLEKKFGNTK